MKFKKLQLCMAAVFTALFTIMGSSIASASTLDYGTSLKRMQDLGIMDSTITNTSTYITRGQLVKSIVISEGKASSANALNGSTIYPDIDPSSSLSGYINQGVNLGTDQGIKQNVVCGRADGNFHPDDQVSYGELCTMMVRLLGYSDSDVTGAWPNNYIQKAADLDLTTDITLKRSDKVTVGIEALMFDRLFDSTMKSTGTTSKFFSDNYYNDTSVTGTPVEAVVIGNSNTSSSLKDSQIITDKATYTLKRGTTIPEIGGKYKMYVDGTTVTKVSPKENTLERYAVSNVSGSTINYIDENDKISSMNLPEATGYYYHGESISYEAAVKSVRPYSSITLAKDSNGNNDYLVITDPVLSSPLVYGTDSEKISDLIEANKYDYIYKDGNKYTSSSYVGLNNYDVVYEVSDLWGKNSFLYVYHDVVSGEITDITPNQLNPDSITVNVAKVNTTYNTSYDPSGGSKTTTNTSTSYTPTVYTFSKYFDRTRLNLSNNNFEKGNYINLIMDINGKVLDIY